MRFRDLAARRSTGHSGTGDSRVPRIQFRVGVVDIPVAQHRGCRQWRKIVEVLQLQFIHELIGILFVAQWEDSMCQKSQNTMENPEAQYIDMVVDI